MEKSRYELKQLKMFLLIATVLLSFLLGYRVGKDAALKEKKDVSFVNKGIR